MKRKNNSAGITEVAVSICIYLILASSLILTINQKITQIRGTYLKTKIVEELDYVNVLQSNFFYADPYSGNNYPIIDLSKIKSSNIATDFSKNVTTLIYQNNNSTSFCSFCFPIILYSNGTLSEGLLEIYR